MKKIINYLVVSMAILLMAACGNTSGGSSEAGFPEGDITLIVPWSAGGGTDTGTRVLQPYLEDELGVNVSVVNRTGGGGWVGWNELINSNPDGYTIAVANSPHIITGYMNPALERDKSLEDFTTLGRHVIDPDTISIRPDEDRFTNIEELVEYAQENTLTVTATGEGTDEHVMLMNFNDKYDTNFEPVHFEGAAESRSALLGGHVDVLIANAGEVLGLYNDEEINLLGVAASERFEFLEDIPTLEEQGYEIYQESSRGLVGPAGMDEEVVATLEQAISNAVNNEEHISEMNELGFSVNYADGEEYGEILAEDEQTVVDLQEILGW